MLRPDGFAKVLDFGLAKLAPATLETAGGETTHTVLKTEAGTVVGTAAYMSPEQTRGQDVDARTDIWSLGVLLYEMVAGRRPFEEPTGSDVLAAILDRDPAPLMQLEPHTPSELQRIVTKALRKDRERRYQLMKDLRLDLESLREEAFPRQPASSDGAVVPSSGSIPPIRQSGTDTGRCTAPTPSRTRGRCGRSGCGYARRGWQGGSGSLTVCPRHSTARADGHTADGQSGRLVSQLGTHLAGWQVRRVLGSDGDSSPRHRYGRDATIA